MLVVTIAVYTYGKIRVDLLRKALGGDDVLCFSVLDRQLKERLGRFVLAYAMLTTCILVIASGVITTNLDLLYVSSMASPLYGIADAFVYFGTPRVREQVWALCSKCNRCAGRGSILEDSRISRRHLAHDTDLSVLSSSNNYSAQL